MTANKGPDSDLIFSLGIIFADGPVLPLIAAVWGGREAAASPAPPASPQPGLDSSGALLVQVRYQPGIKTSVLMGQYFMKYDRQETLNGDV